MLVNPPIIEDREITPVLFCGPGPCNLLPSVQEALTKPVLSAVCDEYFAVEDDIRAGLKYAFQTESNLVLAMSGSGHSGMEAVIVNILGPKDKLLVACRGLWDERAATMAKRYGIKVFRTEVPHTATFGFDQLEAELKRVRPKALFITHGDSTTGTIQKLEGLGDICHKYGTLLIVDTVVSIGGAKFLMDEWGIDAVYTSTQKALSGPAGITPVAFSARAEKVINSRKHEPPFYFDVKLLAQQWNCYGNTRAYHHTLSPPLLWALRASLIELCRETLPKAWERHTKTAAHFHKRLSDFGFELLIPKPEDRLNTVTTVLINKKYNIPEFLKYMRNKHRIVIFGGLGPTVGKALRIGLMGVNSTVQVAEDVALAMADTSRALTKSSL
ncbi:alanine--glyoxylate aminotransferase [Leptidea sinapis]|uniref:alanine--glyoxylate aminotransferase n=1 Tax=Leptidea sinapis TaxID=189913 RepID=UPI0021C467B3|nr:alanine--glyoxylate aminotransferase [Leptidea sinapis]XP_050680819.1 alanine--glyoxylate aminotransferase [Leptidea sinapis]